MQLCCECGIAQAPVAGELIFPLSAQTKSALALDMRFALRDARRARALPMLRVLAQTVERNPERVRFPAEVLDELAREIEVVRDKLAPESPLLDLLARARAPVLAAAPPPPLAAAPPWRLASAPPWPLAAAPGGKTASVALTKSEELHTLRQAAAAIEVNFLVTAEMDESVLAGYLNYCMTLGEHAKIVATLWPRRMKPPRVWSWNLLLTAMRLSVHPELESSAAEFHAWIEAAHPAAVNLLRGPGDQRRLDNDRIRAIEALELAPSAA